MGDRGAPKQSRLGRFGQFAFKVLCPEPLVTKLMSDKEIHAIEEKTGTHFQLSPRNDFYPETRLRVLTVIGEAEENVLNALMVLLDHIEALGAQELESGKRGDFSEKDGRIMFRCALSKAAAGAVIGSKGEKIRRLRDTSGAHIDIDREVHDSHQLVTCIGSRAQIAGIIEEFHTVVQADSAEEWFQQWAAQRGVAAGLGPTAGTGPRGDRGDRGERRRHGEVEGGDRRRHDTSKHKGATIFVGRLSQQTTTDTLASFFATFGEVIDSDVRTDSITGRSKGFGFITFADPDSVEACLDRKSEHSIDGRWVDVKRYGETDGGDDGIDEPNLDDVRFGGDRTASARGVQPPSTDTVWADGETRGTIPWFGNLAGTINPDYVGLEYCITCSLPSAKCGALIGRRGENITEVQRMTGARVEISKKDPHETADAHRTVSITGPLLAVYGAHMLMMRNYNDEEARFENGGGGGADAQRVEELQRKLAELSEELAAARGPAGGGGGRPRHGGGGGGGGARVGGGHRGRR